MTAKKPRNLDYQNYHQIFITKDILKKNEISPDKMSYLHLKYLLQVTSVSSGLNCVHIAHTQRVYDLGNYWLE